MLNTLSKTKNWYMVRGEDYSSNLRFFREHQIGMSKSGNVITFYSRLEKYLFKELKVNKGSDVVEYDTITAEIHKNLLNGKYGQGKFIN